ncbi:MAG: MOSC domain-containing protein [Oscillatoriales cyanobacterium C42_A2020_001]|nr:MOSC domain-containing protein [Leptolyngbyaceae cyanobacterium C42_A2020_001]
MARMLVGTVASLWRYPVKSMLGEKLDAVEVVEQGILGDRAYALWDKQTSRVASAKNPKKWAKLLEFQAAYVESPQTQEAMPAVQFALPDGSSTTSDATDINTTLSQVLGRQVQLLSSVPEAPSLDQYWPDVAGTAHQDKVTQLFMPPGTFFDSCPIHLITTATLARLQELYPAGQFEPCRFRPNVLIEPAIADITFVENDWVGGILAIGDRVRLSIDTACPRCVVTTLAQAGLPNDLNILRTTAQHNNVIAGIRTSVLQTGAIRLNDPIWLEQPA